MATLTLALLATLLVLGSAVTVFVFLHRSSGTTPPRQLTAGAQPSLLTLGIGDVLDVMGDSYVVAGRATHTDSGQKTFEYRLDGGEKVRWLRAAAGDPVALFLYEEIDGNHDEAGQGRLTHDGQAYTLVMRGHSRVSLEGETERPDSRCRTFDYRGSGDRFLSFQRWGNRAVGLQGRSIRPEQIDILPAGEPRPAK